MFDRALSQCLDRAIARLPELWPDAPHAGSALSGWARSLSAPRPSRDYFEGGRAIIFLLPWWLEKQIRPLPDRAFHEQLVESSVCAYYAVRIVDNVLDEDAPAERALLPLVALLHARFVRVYAGLFAPGDRFWAYFEAHWSATADAALREKQLGALAPGDFEAVAARKTAGVKIPLAAVCCRYDRMTLLEGWCRFYDRFAAWQQMADDTFDWLDDLRSGNRTYFLSEAERSRRPGESVAGWAVRGGLAWALGRLADDFARLHDDARALESEELTRFLQYREAEFRELRADLAAQLPQVAKVADVFEPIDRLDLRGVRGSSRVRP